MPQLRPYQQEVIDFATRAGGRFIYADQPGSGKTPTVAAMLNEWQPSGPTLVVSPDGVCDHWIEEIERWSPIIAVDGRGAPEARNEARHDAYNTHSGNGYRAAMVINYDLMRRDIEDILKFKWDVVVFDEAHRLKGRTNGVANAAIKLARRARGVAALTGTPALNAPEEVWELLHLVRPKVYTSYWRWVYTHFYVDITDFHGKLAKPIKMIRELKPGHDELIRTELDQVMIGRNDLLPMIPLVNTIHEVELSEKERRVYDNMDKKGWAHIDGELIATTTEVARITRLRQMASEWSGLGELIDFGTKVSRTIELVRPSTEQYVILTAFKATARRLADELDAVTYLGTDNTKARRKNVEAFRRGDRQCVIGTIAAMGEGVDGLQVAHRMIRLDRDWTPARNDQVIGRVRRFGQQFGSVYVDDIVARDTIDEDVAKLLAEKAHALEVVIR